MNRVPWMFAAVLAAAVGESALGDDRVLIIPFNVLNVPAAQQWIGKGVEENLVAQLGRGGGMTPVAFTGAVIVEDNATAARLARGAKAPLAIRGTAQVVGESVRLTAQLIDSKTGETVRTGLVTGKTSDVLALEDELAKQLSAVPAPAGAGTTAPPATAAITPVSLPVASPPVVIISQPQPVYYPVYPYAYNYPYNPYSWSYPLVIYQVAPSDRDRGRGREHEGRGGGGGGGGGPRSGSGGGGFNANGLPIPTNNVLPIPTNNVLPIPTNNVLPLPRNNVLPLPTNNVLPLPTNRAASLPTVSVSTAGTNAGQNRNPRLVN